MTGLALPRISAWPCHASPPGTAVYLRLALPCISAWLCCASPPGHAGTQWDTTAVWPKARQQGSNRAGHNGTQPQWRRKRSSREATERHNGTQPQWSRNRGIKDQFLRARLGPKKISSVWGKNMCDNKKRSIKALIK